MEQFLKLLHHSNPGLSILEIGLGGDKFAPVSLMSKLKDTAEILETAHYTFTVGHENSQQAAADQFGSLKSRVHVNVLDIEKPEVAEDKENFDLVLLFNAGMATSNPEIIISNTAKMLKETGRICIVDIDQPLLQLGTIIGSIQGVR